MKVLAIEGSTREDSATLIALQSFLKAKESNSNEILRLKNLDLPQFRDTRGGGEWALSPDVETLYEKMIAADHIVLASPLYWYSVSNLMKNFLDHWTYYLRHPKAPMKESMKGKNFSFLVVGSGPKNHLVEPVFHALRYSVEYIGAVGNDEVYHTENEARELQG